jgi:glycosyltransferase involved in cell wall biosynthesis
VTQPSKTSISVVIPTRDRPNALARCLGALAAQTVGDELEILVVDDGSTAESAVSAAVARHSHARLIRRAGVGPAAARNAGARAASGTVVCFTDDDCVPSEDWVEQLLSALRQGADAAGGRTTADGGALAEASELIARAPVVEVDRHYVSFAPSNNLACWRSVIDAVPFDETFPHAAGEDREWCARLLASRYSLRFVSSARVVHRQELNLVRFLRQQFRYGEGAFRFRERTAESRRLESAHFYIALVRRAFETSLAVGLLVLVAQGATALGFIRGWVAREESSAGASQSQEEQRPRT